MIIGWNDGNNLCSAVCVMAMCAVCVMAMWWPCGHVWCSPHVAGEIGDFGVAFELRRVAEVDAVTFGVFQVLLVLVLTSTRQNAMTPKQTENKNRNAVIFGSPARIGELETISIQWSVSKSKRLNRKHCSRCLVLVSSVFLTHILISSKYSLLDIER